MAATPERPALRYIPFRKRDVVEMCLTEGSLSAVEKMQFRDVCQLLQSVFHFDFHQVLEDLKDTYAPLNPDRDTRKIAAFGSHRQTEFVDQLQTLLNGANYERLTDEALAQALNESSLFKLKLDIDFDDFSDVLLFTRGESQREEMDNGFFGRMRRKLSFTNYDRVVIYIRFSDNMPNNPQGFRPGSIMLKMFQNVPQADIEILFPNTQVRMRLLDKLMIGVPVFVGGGIVLTTKVSASLLLLGTLIGYYAGIHSQAVAINEAVIIGLIAGMGALGSFIWKQFVNFKNRKLTFMQTLTQSLYFKNLDNNSGVFHRLLDDAEEEECKEAILAYYFLTAMPNITTAAALDEAIEAWLSTRWQSNVDFEINDALRKLIDLGLVKQQGDTLLAVDLTLACKQLDRRWDNYFTYSSG
jgi:hypothetical protein